MSCSKVYTPTGVIYDFSGGRLSSDYRTGASAHNSQMNPHGEVKIHKWKRLICDVPVEFPGTPYGEQIKMMKRVIEGLQGKQNNLIESPTGTGKTLALLCAVLAWVKHTGFKGKIYYTTRTHSQVTGVIKELKKTAYKNIRTTILGSRKQMCIHPDKPRPPKPGDWQDKKVSVDAFCQKLRNSYKNKKKAVVESDDDYEEERKPGPSKSKKPKKKAKACQTCEYYETLVNLPKETKESILFAKPVMDIEEFKRNGESCTTCPYYTAMFRHEKAQLIICPYNYIISKQLRRSCKIVLEDSLVIFDEGHNVEKACCDEASYSIKGKSIRLLRESVLAAKSNGVSLTSAEVNEELDIIAELLNRLHTYIKNNCRGHNRKTCAIIMQELKEGKMGLRPIRKCCESLENIQEYESNYETTYLDADVVTKIRKMLYVLEILYSHCGTNNDPLKLRDYHLSFPTGEEEDESGACLHVLCMNPAVVFREIAEATTSVTITSGTLSPLGSYTSLGTQFPHPTSLDQVISPERYMVAALGIGPRNEQLELTYKNRVKDNVMYELGMIVLRVCKVVPNGVTAFAPSASYINQLVEFWYETGILEKIEKYKHIFNEADKNTEKLEKRYKEKSRNPGSGSKNGALLLAYFRGTMSEGVDFKDEEARAVITLGIPLQPFTGITATARREYHTQNEFDQWYTTDAFRAFNQAIGRCVRHSEDWGAVIMIEQRIASQPWGNQPNKYDEYLPGWIRNATQRYAEHNSFPRMIQNLKQFVGRMTVADEDETDESEEEMADSGYVRTGNEDGEEIGEDNENVEEEEGEDDVEEEQADEEYADESDSAEEEDEEEEDDDNESGIADEEEESDNVSDEGEEESIPLRRKKPRQRIVEESATDSSEDDS